jgi:phage/plasmid-like protein (TIGR03299 family)
MPTPFQPAVNPADSHNPATALVTDFTKASDTGLAPWQAAGTKIPNEVLTAEDVLERSGNRFRVKTVPAYAKVGDDFYMAKDSKMVVREDNNTVLGVVGNKYRVIQNEDQLGAISPLVTSGFAKYDTAGLVYGGEIGWVMLKLNDEIVLPGSNDVVLKYLMCLWSHNGTFSLRIFPAPLRAFCANVLNSLLSSSSAKSGISIRHTSSADARIKEASRIIEASQGFYNDFAQRAASLSAKRMTDAQMKALTEHLFPAKANTDGEVEVSTRSQNIRDQIMDLFVKGAGHEAIRGTAWAGYNAVAEFADHFRTTRVEEGGNEKESRFAATMWGTGNALKTKAINYIDNELLAA